MRLYEKYRPRCLDDIIGQQSAVKAARLCMARGTVGGNTFWVTGPTGVGKTTIAKIVAASIADPEFVSEVVGREVDRAWLEKLAFDCRLHATGKGGRAWIVNEAHGLSKGAIERLLDLTEALPDHACILFTTTWDGEDGLLESQIDARPLLGRCTKLRLTNQGLAAAAAPKLREWAMAESLDGQSEAAYVKLMQNNKNSIRACLVDIAAGGMLKGD